MVAGEGKVRRVGAGESKVKEWNLWNNVSAAHIANAAFNDCSMCDPEPPTCTFSVSYMPAKF